MAETAQSREILPDAGTMVVVVGPSGAGKDSVIGYALSRLGERPDIHLVRRLITRPADAGGEQHEALSESEFETRLHAGDFAVDWTAHGLRYGIPASVRDELAKGHVVIANGSRAVLDRFKDAFPSLLIVNIVTRPEILAERLGKRGRETTADIALRLERAESVGIHERFSSVTIDNSGPLETAGEHFLCIIKALIDGKA